MASFARTNIGFANALEHGASLARVNPQNRYVIYVHKDKPDEYQVTHSILVKRNNVAEGIKASMVDENGNLTPIFDE